MIYIYTYIYINDLAATKDKIIYHHAYGAGPPEAVCHGPCFSQLARLKDVWREVDGASLLTSASRDPNNNIHLMYLNVLQPQTIHI